VWQPCRTHFMRKNLLTRVPKSAQAMVATLVRTIFAQPDAESVWAQHTRVVEQLTERFAAAAELHADAAGDVLAFTAFPKERRKQIWSNKSLRAAQQEAAPSHRRRPHHRPVGPGRHVDPDASTRRQRRHPRRTRLPQLTAQTCRSLKCDRCPPGW
jgi:transposase-like protein